MAIYKVTLKKISITFADVHVDGESTEEANQKLKEIIEHDWPNWGESEIYIDPPDVITKI